MWCIIISSPSTCIVVVWRTLIDVKSGQDRQTGPCCLSALLIASSATLETGRENDGIESRRTDTVSSAADLPSDTTAGELSMCRLGPTRPSTFQPKLPRDSALSLNQVSAGETAGISCLWDVRWNFKKKNKKAVLSQGNRAMPQLFFSV